MQLKNYKWLLVFALLIAACAPPATTLTDTQIMSTDAQVEPSAATNTLRIATPFLSTPMDPIQGGSFYTVQWGFGETLLRLDATFQPVPWLAEQLTPLDETQWEIKLRAGVTFHDGAPMDATAVKASLERAVENNATAKQLLDAQAITVVDDLTLIITTNTPNLRMPGVLTEPTTVILNAAAALAQGDEQFGLKPIMTGPFAVVETVIGQSVKLRRYDRYWGGAAKLDAIEIVVLADADARMLALQSGEADIAADIRPESVTVAEADPNLNVVLASPVATIFMYINQHKPIWQDPKLRQVLAYATPDRNALVKTVLRDQGIPGLGPIPPTILACDNLQATPPDLEKAKQLLAEAGYVDSDGDGVVEKDGQPLALIAISYPQRASLTPTSEIIQANLQEIGIGMEIRSVENIDATLKEADWDIGMYFNNMAATGDPYGPLANFYTKDGAANRGGYLNAAVEAQIAELRDIPALDQRRAKACEISQALLDDTAIVPLFYPFYPYGVSTQVAGFTEAHPYFLYFLNNTISK